MSETSRRRIDIVNHIRQCVCRAVLKRLADTAVSGSFYDGGALTADNITLSDEEEDILVPFLPEYGELTNPPHANLNVRRAGGGGQ